MLERLRECEAVQEPITRAARDALVGARSKCSSTRSTATVSVGRTHREAPEIDGIVRLVADFARPGALVKAHVTEAIGPDLVAKSAGAKAAQG